MLADRNVAIKLIGVGGAGSNAVDRLKMENLDRLQLAVINTDYQALASSPVQDKVLIGMSVTRGLGAGGDPELGREAAEVGPGEDRGGGQGLRPGLPAGRHGWGHRRRRGADRGGNRRRGRRAGDRFRLAALQLRGRPPAEAGRGGAARAAPGLRRGDSAAQRRAPAGGRRQRDRPRFVRAGRRMGGPRGQVDLVDALQDRPDQPGFCDPAPGLPAARRQDALRPERGPGRERGDRSDREPEAVPAAAHPGVFPQGRPAAREHHRGHGPHPPEGQRDHGRGRRAVRPRFA